MGKLLTNDHSQPFFFDEVANMCRLAVWHSAPVPHLHLSGITWCIWGRRRETGGLGGLFECVDLTEFLIFDYQDLANGEKYAGL